MVIRLLVADPDISFVVMLKQALELGGDYEVHVFATAQAALEEAERERYDAAIVDFSVRGMPGPELVRRLRKLQPSIAILVVPGPEDVNLSELGAQGALRKPYYARELGPILREAIEAVHMTPPPPTVALRRDTGGIDDLDGYIVPTEELAAGEVARRQMEEVRQQAEQLLGSPLDEVPAPGADMPLADLLEALEMAEEPIGLVEEASETPERGKDEAVEEPSGGQEGRDVVPGAEDVTSRDGEAPKGNERLMARLARTAMLSEPDDVTVGRLDDESIDDVLDALAGTDDSVEVEPEPTEVYVPEVMEPIEWAEGGPTSSGQLPEDEPAEDVASDTEFQGESTDRVTEYTLDTGESGFNDVLDLMAQTPTDIEDELGPRKGTGPFEELIAQLQTPPPPEPTGQSFEEILASMAYIPIDEGEESYPPAIDDDALEGVLNAIRNSEERSDLPALPSERKMVVPDVPDDGVFEDVLAALRGEELPTEVTEPSDVEMERSSEEDLPTVADLLGLDESEPDETELKSEMLSTVEGGPDTELGMSLLKTLIEMPIEVPEPTEPALVADEVSKDGEVRERSAIRKLEPLSEKRPKAAGGKGGKARRSRKKKKRRRTKSVKGIGGKGTRLRLKLPFFGKKRGVESPPPEPKQEPEAPKASTDVPDETEATELSGQASHAVGWDWTLPWLEPSEEPIHASGGMPEAGEELPDEFVPPDEVMGIVKGEVGEPEGGEEAVAERVEAAGSSPAESTQQMPSTQVGNELRQPDKFTGQPELDDEALALEERLGALCEDVMADVCFLTKNGVLLVAQGRLDWDDALELAYMAHEGWVPPPATRQSQMRFVRLESVSKDYTLYSTTVGGGWVLSGAFCSDVSISRVRREINSMAEALSELLARREEKTYAPEPTQESAEGTESDGREQVAEAEMEGAETEELRPRVLGAGGAKAKEPTSVPMASYTCAWLVRDMDEVIIPDEMRYKLAVWLRELAEERGWRLELVEIHTGYVYVQVEAPASDLPVEVVEAMKFYSAQRVAEEFPDVGADVSFWADGYYLIMPPREITQQEMRRFIAYQHQANSEVS